MTFSSETSKALHPWRSLSTSSTLTLFLAVFPLTLFGIATLRHFFSPKYSRGIYDLNDNSIITIWPFFRKRYDFMWSNFKKTDSNMFRFRLFRHTIVGLRGVAARKAFFNEPTLDFLEGYRILRGAVPQLQDIDVVDPEKGDLSFFRKQLLNLLNKERIEEVLPTLFDYLHKRVDGWGNEGMFNPFEDIFDLVFQATVRLATCRELAEDQDALAKFTIDYWEHERSSTPSALLFPWLPSPATRAKKRSTRGLFMLLYRYISIRRAAKIPTSDAIDVLISGGGTNEGIIGFILSTITAGVVNTGRTVCWNLIYLTLHPEWKEKVLSEFHSLIANHSSLSSDHPMHKRLASISMAAWEDETPVVDAVIRETLRMLGAGTAIRRNIGKDLDIEGATINRGEFLAFSFADVHHNPDIYPEPLTFDPARYDPGRAEDKKEPLAFVGWGAGRHPCLGMRLAKLELKLLLALIFTSYDFELVDSNGYTLSTPPRPDYNDVIKFPPLNKPCFFKYHRIVG